MMNALTFDIRDAVETLAEATGISGKAIALGLCRNRQRKPKPKVFKDLDTQDYEPI